MLKQLSPKRKGIRGTPILNNDMLEYIFSYLPIMSTVRMGTLSSRFRYSWEYCCNLDFGKNFTLGRSLEEFIRIVDRVLNHHVGPKVCKFRVFLDPGQRKLEEWLHFAAMKGVEEVNLDFSAGWNLNSIKVPDFLLDCGSVKVLTSTFCEFRAPAFSFNVFCSLTTLSLRWVDVTDRAIHCVPNMFASRELRSEKCLGLHTLIISARNLGRFKVLKVINCYNLSWLNIDAPTLCSLHYSGNIKRFVFSFGSTANLKDAVLDFSASTTKRIEETLYMKNLPIDIAYVNSLTVTSIFLQGLSPKYVDGELRAIQFCLHNLKVFQLLMKKKSYCNPYDIALFLENCPCVERISIDLRGFSFHCGNYWELQGKEPLGQFDCKFQHLRYVKLKGFKFEKYELLLVKFVLEKAIVLETLFLVLDHNYRQRISAEDMEMHNQLFLSWRASPKTKIVVSENSKGTCVCVYPLQSQY